MATVTQGKTFVDTQGKTQVAQFNPNTGAPLSAGQSVAVAAKTPSVSNSSYGTDAKTGLPVGPGNDPKSATSTAPEAPPTPVNPQSTGQVSYEQAQKNLLAPGGLKGQALADAQTGLASYYKQPSKYETGLASKQASGESVPPDSGAARAAATSAMPRENDTSAIDTFVGDNKAVTGVMDAVTKLLNPVQQTTSLMDDYSRLYKESGLSKINQELIDADTVINGTEDDIRNEIQTAGGFGTESQVQAMSLARNKSLLKRYNQLVQMKTDAANQLNTMSQLNVQDKQMAQQRVDSQINSIFKLADFKQQATKNIQEAFTKLVDKVGYAGAYAAYASDPRQLGFIEQAMGLTSGGLEKLSTYIPKLSEEEKLRNENLRLQNLKLTKDIATSKKPNTQVVDVGGKKFLINSDTGETIKEVAAGDTESSNLQLSQAQTDISSVDSLVKDPYLNTAVGPNTFARTSFKNFFTGGKDNFVASVEQLRSKLSLESLQNAKKNGATFGALSEGELALLQNSGSKISSWAIKGSDGKVTGYQVGEADFKKELDRVNNFSKLDFILKGGLPTSIGVQEIDGAYWTQNSDGSFTRLN